MRVLQVIPYLLFGIFFGFNARAQEKPDKLNNFNIQSPTAYSFSLVNNVPANLFTGQINVSVPLFNKTIGGIQFNMEATYMGGNGIQADARSTILGKAWMLKTGGVITRHKRGIPDDYKNDIPTGAPYFYDGILNRSTGISTQGDGDYLSEWMEDLHSYEEGAGDAQHDIFEFNVMGRSGKFYIGKNWEILLVPDSKLKIIPSVGSPVYKEGEKVRSTITSFTIIDEAGYKYIFSAVEVKREMNEVLWDDRVAKNKLYIESWLLSRVEAPFNTDFVTYTYGETRIGSGEGAEPFNQYYQMYEKRSDETFGSFIEPSIYTFSANELYLTTINFSDNSSITFDYFNGHTIYAPILKRINFLDPDQQLKKHISLSYQGISGNYGYRTVNRNGNDDLYATALGLRRHTLFLESIREVAPDGTSGSTHIFDYYMERSQMSNENLKGIDHWGYFNGKPAPLGNLIPVATISQRPPADRSPDLAYAKIGALKKIQYATGGYEEFEYQLNEIQTPSGPAYRGGLRLSKRTLRNRLDPAGDMVREYKYLNADGTSSGFLGDMPIYRYVKNVYQNDGSWPSNPNIRRTHTIDVSISTNPLSHIEGSSVGYRRVEEIIGGASNSNGSIIHEFSDLSYTQLWDQPDYFPYRPVDRPTWALGLPLKLTYLDKNGRKVKETINRYSIREARKTTENFRSMHVSKAGEIHNPLNGNINQTKPVYRVKTYYPIYGRAELYQTEDNTYTDNNMKLSTIKNYTYDENSLALRTTSTSTSGTETVERLYYPYDYNLGLPSGITRLNELGITAPVITKETWIKRFGMTDYSLVRASVNDYGVFLYTYILPAKVYEYEAVTPRTSAYANDFPPYAKTQLLPDNNYGTWVSFTRYNSKGRLLEYQNRGDANEAIVADEQDRIVAKAINTPVDHIAFTSFESSYTGGWNYTGTSQADVSAPTGIRAFDLAITGSTGIRKDGLSNLKQYFVSYWVKGSSALSIPGTLGTPLNGRTRSGWTHFKHLISNRTEIIVSGNAVIDELRLYPKDAVITTYTHAFLDGVTSITDANDRTVYYEYNKFSKLKVVRDDKGNIIKQFDYHYAPVEYNPTPIWDFTANIRCIPCPQNAGYLSGLSEREERDVNPASPTFNTFRWVNYATCDDFHAWQATGAKRCLKDINNENTGEHEFEEKSLNPCSPYYNTTRWMPGGQDLTTCPDTRATHAVVCRRNFTYNPDGKVYADIIVSFYTSAGMNLPRNVSSLPVKIEETGGNTPGITTYPCTGTSTILFYQTLIRDNNDPNFTERTFSVVPGPGYSTEAYLPCEN